MDCEREETADGSPACRERCPLDVDGRVFSNYGPTCRSVFWLVCKLPGRWWGEMALAYASFFRMIKGTR